MGTAGDKGGRGVKVTTHLSLVSKECSCNYISPYGFKGVHIAWASHTLAVLPSTFSNNKIRKRSCLLGYDAV